MIISLGANMTDQDGNNHDNNQSRKGTGRQDGHKDPDNIPEEDILCCCPPTCSPSWLQRFANPKMFTFHMMITLSFSMMSFVYLGGVLTTIERNFQLDSASSGSITIAADIISTLLVIPLSHYGQMGHRPRWIGTGILMTAVGTMLCAVPHFVSDPINPKIILTGSIDDVQDLCSSDEEGFLSYNATESTTNVSHGHDGSGDQRSSRGDLRTVWWIVLGQIINGIGNAPLEAIIMTYIDDAVKLHKLTAYTAVLFTSFTVGPACGFLFAAFTTKLYVDFDRVPSDQIPAIDQNDPRWIGAWWLGFVILSIILAFLSLPIFFYPRTMSSAVKKWKQEKKQAEAEAEEGIQLNETPVAVVNADDKDDDDGENIEDNVVKERSGSTYAHLEGNAVDTVIKGPILALKRLLCNPTNMFLVLQETIFMSMIAIEGAFGVKYPETQFSLSPSEAALLTAIVIGPSNIISNFFSGYVCQRFKFNSKQCCLFIIVCTLLPFILYPIGMLLGCPNVPIAGVTTSYDGLMAPSHGISNGCNLHCACSEEIFQPVCGSNGLTYISPCHAGCNTEISRFNNITATPSTFLNEYEYSDCNCITNSTLSNGSITNLFSSTKATDEVDATAGQCANPNCQGAIPVMLLFSAIFFFQAAAGNPMVFIGLRCVRDEDRSMAIALRSVFSHCIGFLPAPIYFGSIINSMCILWQSTDGERGSCWVYDNTRYRVSYFVTSMALQGLALVATGFMYFTIKEKLRNKKLKENNNLEENEMAVEA